MTQRSSTVSSYVARLLLGVLTVATSLSLATEARSCGSPNSTRHDTATVQMELADSVTALTSSENPSVQGQAVTLTATVTSSFCIPVGTVALYLDGNRIDEGSLVDSAVSFIVSPPPGTSEYEARYEGSIEHNVSSTTLVQQVKADTSTTLVSTPNPSASGQTVELIATVNSLGGGVPAGSVSFRNGAAEIGRASLSGVLAGNGVIAAGGTHSCALTSGGGLVCWGANRDTEPGSATPLGVAGLSADVQMVGVGAGYFTCALTVTGAVKCWGKNGSGQLGDGSGADSATPVNVAGLETGSSAIATGVLHACAIVADRGVMCWGNNSRGQLGDGSLMTGLSPVRVSPLENVQAVVAGNDHTCALSTDHVVRCWGGNTVGQLGTGAIASEIRQPGQHVPIGQDVSSIAAGSNHTCALTVAGSVYCWGWNQYGQLGDGTSTTRKTPRLVLGLSSGVQAIAANGTSTCALTSSGEARCWGDNSNGQLGDGTTVDRTQPQAVVGLSSSVYAIAVGSSHSCALMISGTASCWGANQKGQLGDGTFVSRPVPAGVAGLTGQVRAAGSFSTNAFAAGEHILSAAFEGSEEFLPSESAPVAHTVRALTTTALVTSTGNPTLGDVITLTANVSSPDGIPDGNVTFYNGRQTRGTVALVSGVATVSMTVSSIELNDVSVVYHGSEAYVGSTSDKIILDIQKASTSTTLNPNPTSWVYGQLVNLSASVTSTFGPIPDTRPATGGGMNFYSGPALIAQAYVYDGTGTARKMLGAGVYAVRAVYGGTTTFASSQSSVTTVTVSRAATRTTLRSSASVSTPGAPVTLTALARSDVSVLPTGTVTFYDGTSSIGTAVIRDGEATLTTSGLAFGRHELRAAYFGNGNYLGSTSSTIVQTVKHRATVSLAASAAQVTPLTAVTFSARVTATTGAPSGTVTFKDGAVPLATVTLAQGVARFTTTNLAYGRRQITAVYNGSPIHIAATSASAPVLVTYAIGSQAKLNIGIAYPATRPAAANLAGGGAVVVWEGQGSITGPLTIVARRIGPSGLPLEGEVAVGPAGAGVGSPHVAGLTNGDFVVVWHAGPAGQRNVLARRFTNNGTPKGLIARVNKTTGRDNSRPQVAALANGGFFIAWQSTTTAGLGSDIHARRFDGAGVPSALQLVVNTTISGEQTTPSIVALANGNAAIAWSSTVTGGFSPFFQLYSPNGAKSGPERRLLATPVSAAPRIAATALPAGAFALAWHRPVLAATTPTDVYLQRLAATGAAVGSPLRINTITAGNQSDPALATLTGSNFVSAWTGVDSSQPASMEGVETQLFRSAGQRIYQPFLANAVTANRERFPTIAAYGPGTNYLVAWSVSRSGHPDGNVFMQRFGPVAASTAAQPATVRIGNGAPVWQTDM
jgi:alpha-tubulin suppressor-like RCC1 family protein